MIGKKNIKYELIWDEDEFKDIRKYANDKLDNCHLTSFNIILGTAFYDEHTKKYHLIANKTQYKLIRKLYKEGA